MDLRHSPTTPLQSGATQYAVSTLLIKLNIEDPYHYPEDDPPAVS